MLKIKVTESNIVRFKKKKQAEYVGRFTTEVQR